MATRLDANPTDPPAIDMGNAGRTIKNWGAYVLIVALMLLTFVVAAGTLVPWLGQFVPADTGEGGATLQLGA